MNFSPEQQLKVCRMLRSAPSSVASGLAKMLVSSAYRKQLRVAGLGRICERIPDWTIRSIILWKGSMDRIKRIGENGSPWQSPRLLGAYAFHNRLILRIEDYPRKKAP